jgi:hypothetical protein
MLSFTECRKPSLRAAVWTSSIIIPIISMQEGAKTRVTPGVPPADAVSSSHSIRRGKRHHSVFRNPQILGIGSHALAAISKDLVAFSESFYILSHCFNFSGKLSPQDVPPNLFKIWMDDSKSAAPCNETNAGTIAAGLCQVCSLVPRSTVHF